MIRLHFLHGSTSEWITWDIVDLVSAWHNGTYANHGVMSIGQDESIVDNTLFILYSRDYSKQHIPSCVNRDLYTGISSRHCKYNPLN